MADPKPSVAAALYHYVTLRDDMISRPTEVELAEAEAEVNRAVERRVEWYMRRVGTVD